MSALTCSVTAGVSWPSVIAHVLVATLQHGSASGQHVRALGHTHFHGVGEGVHAAVREGRVGAEWIQDPREAGTQVGLAHVTRGHTVWGIAVAPDFSCR